MSKATIKTTRRQTVKQVSEEMEVITSADGGSFGFYRGGLVYCDESNWQPLTLAESIRVFSDFMGVDASISPQELTVWLWQIRESLERGNQPGGTL